MGFVEDLAAFNENMTTIADAVRSATGSSDKMDLADIAIAIPEMSGTIDPSEVTVTLKTSSINSPNYITYVTYQLTQRIGTDKSYIHGLVYHLSQNSSRSFTTLKTIGVSIVSGKGSSTDVAMSVTNGEAFSFGTSGQFLVIPTSDEDMTINVVNGSASEPA